MFEGLNRTLIECVRSAQILRGGALVEIRKMHEFGAYTNEYLDSESRRIVNDLIASKDERKAAGLAAIAAKLEEISGTETREAELRAMDTDYLKRLDMKLDTVGRLVSKNVYADGSESINTPDLSDDVLRTYFAEFVDDPIARATIINKLGARGIAIAPEDHTGKKQAHIKKVKAVFETIMDRTCNIGDSGVSSAQNVESFGKAEEDAFAAYCRAQNDDFSLDDEEVFAGMIADAPEMKTAIDSIKWRISRA